MLIGRLTKDPELRYLPGDKNTAVATFTLAVDRNLSRDLRDKYQSEGKPTADFIRCKAWAGLAEVIAQHGGKGKRIAIQGSIETGAYDHKDGYKVYTTEVIARNIDIIDWKENTAEPDMDFYTTNDDVPF